jgi:hypothetical protein
MLTTTAAIADAAALFTRQAAPKSDVGMHCEMETAIGVATIRYNTL